MSDWYRESRDIPSETQDQQDAPPPLSPRGRRAMQGDRSQPGAPDAPGDAQIAQLERRVKEVEAETLAREQQVKEQLARQRLQQAGAPSSPGRPAEPPGYQAPAVGERAMDDRVETGPEKKDKEIWYSPDRERGW